MFRPVRKAVFPVGGLGTRFLPATKSMPKEMLPIVDKPLIQYAVEEAKAAGIEEFIFVTGRGKTAIEDHFDCASELEDLLLRRGKSAMVDELQEALPPAGQIAYMRQQSPKGLGHAVWCARHLIGDEPFAVLLADDLIQSRTPCLQQMVDSYRETGGNVLAVMQVPQQDTRKFGIVDPGMQRGSLIAVKGLVEKPDPKDAPSTLSIVGRYILQPEVIRVLSSQDVGAGGEIQLTDAIAKTIGSVPIHGFRFEGTRFDCGDKLGFLKANVAFALARADLCDGLTDYLFDCQELAGRRPHAAAREEISRLPRTAVG